MEGQRLILGDEKIIVISAVHFWKVDSLFSIIMILDLTRKWNLFTQRMWIEHLRRCQKTQIKC